MSISDDFRAWCLIILSSNTFRQIAPLVVLLIVPLLVFTVATRAERSTLFYSITMVLDSLGITLPWSWPSNGNSTSSSTKTLSTHERKKSRKRHIRTRVEHIAMNGINTHDNVDSEDGYYPGLVNISGTYCFMNSTLQALASLCYLQPHIDAIHAKAEALDVPSPVIDALQDLFRKLNTPRSSYHSIRPINIIDVLTHQSHGRTNSLLYSREHQDAQELFQLLSECIKNEIAAVDKEGHRDRGLGGLSQASETTREIGKTIFDGLTANRRSCIVCGYTEAVMHFAFDNWQLAIPRTESVYLEECLSDYTRLEVLRDCICRKCSMLATHRRLTQEAETLTEATQPEAKPSASKKRRLKEVRRMEVKVKDALDQGRIEDDIKDVRMEKVFSTACTKQSMIARPPPVLALHINRSVHYGQYAAKNNARLIFREVLDLTPFTTSGNLSTEPTVSISTPPALPRAIPRSTTPTPSTYTNPRTLYRLTAVVCHFGQHSFGHYICYRRKPRPVETGAKRWAPPKLVDPLRVEESEGQNGSANPGYLWEDEDGHTAPPIRPGKGWLRISDDSVRECGIETVLNEGVGAFMLYYERVIQPRPGVYLLRNSPSEETLKPEMTTVHLNESVVSLVSEVGVGVLKREAETKSRENGGVGLGTPAASAGLGGSQVLGPRIVRSVAAGRRRSASAAPSDRQPSTMSMSVGSIEAGPKPGTPSSLPNGTATHHRNHSSSELVPPVPAPMSASVPALPFVPPPIESTNSTSSSSSASRRPRQPLPSRISSPHHSPAGPSTIGLKA